MAENTKAETGTISVNTEKLLPIIKKWLYSEKDIFLRELVSNAVDAINKLKQVALTSEGKVTAEDPRIDITINKKKETLTISDNGIGMTAEEVKKYINQIAFSGAEDFFREIQKRQREGTDYRAFRSRVLLRLHGGGKSRDYNPRLSAGRASGQMGIRRQQRVHAGTVGA